MAARQGISPIDLERSELRYIFYAHDLDSIIDDFLRAGFKKETHEQTPCTRTVYFGTRNGLKPGLSIKARVYALHREENVWRVDGSTRFNLLEIKSTVKQDEEIFHGLSSEEVTAQMILSDGISMQLSKDVVIRIQKAAEDGILRDSTIKAKSRLKKGDISCDASGMLSLGEILTLLTEPSKLDANLSAQLVHILNGKIRPRYHHFLHPYLVTQYNRLHLVPVDEKWKDFIRVTIDPGVEYYDVTADGESFMASKKALVEYMGRERFCRLEFKLDPAFISSQPSLESSLSDILRRHGCLAYISKKWAGVTLASERYIAKLALWQEHLDKDVSGFFKVDPSWFSYGTIMGELLDLVKKSPNYQPFSQHPRVLVKNDNYVSGHLGVPVPSLLVRVEGPTVRYDLPPVSHPVILSRDKPDFYILEETRQPVRSTLVSSKEELDAILHPSIEIDAHSFFRSYGFLVVAAQTSRVYKITIERKVDVHDKETKTFIYCKMRYAGSKESFRKIDIQDIYRELKLFYSEFSPVMSWPVEGGYE